MVKRVFGRVDGCEVELNRSEGDWWNVPVPFDTDGEYVVEILAEDEAGNQAYNSKDVVCSQYSIAVCSCGAGSLLWTAS